MLNTFMSTSQAVTQQKLEKYLREVRLGKREGSIISVQTVNSLSKEDRVAWRAIRKDLESIGITAEAYEANQVFIRDWLTRALDAGALDEQAISADQEDEAIELESPPPLERSQLVPETKRTYKPSPEGEVLSTIVSWGLGIPRAGDENDTIGLEPPPYARGPGNPKAGDGGRTYQRAVKNQTVSRVATLSPDTGSQIARLLHNPATRRLIDADTVKRAFFTAVLLGHSPHVLELLKEGQQVNATVNVSFLMSLNIEAHLRCELRQISKRGRVRAINLATHYDDETMMAIPLFTKLSVRQLSKNYYKEAQISTKDANGKVHPSWVLY
ncbi:MAG: hypothetical protein Q9226_008489 [Calogaya cf. arnoldii]